MAGLLFTASVAHAYPTAIVFAPTGDSKKLGDAQVFVYSAFNYDPSSSSAGSWLGGNFGIAPAFKYGDSGTGFGGAEVGIDVVNPSSFSGASYVKSILNVKAQLLTESGLIPHLSIGAMDLDPFQSGRGLNLLYLTLTKTIGAYGRLTLGLGDALTSNRALFNGTGLFNGRSGALLAGYESPSFGPFSFAADYFGGTSELSSTNVEAIYSPLPNTSWGIGGFFSNDRSNPATTFDGVFMVVALSWNLAGR
jgi:hypothetical protein